MDSVQEIPAMLSRAGSFYYKNLSAEGTLTARKLTQLHTGCRVFSQMGATGELTTSGRYISDYGVLRFSDSDIDYYGTESALQVRPESNILKLKNYTALVDTSNKALSELDNAARIEQILAFPFTPSTSGEETEFVVGARDELSYGLYIDKNIFVSVIATEQGELLFNGIDFLSFFGLILFKTHPVKLFPKYKFVVPSMTRRCRNLLSFTLGVDDVCGDVSKVMEYYRVSQSPKAFYLAAAQAIGMCVVPEDCEILRVEPLHKGFAYITDKGKLDAPYNHVMLMPPYTLSKNTVIGGNDLFSAVLPGEELPSDLGSVNLDYLLPVKGLYAPNTTVTISVEGKFNPAFEGDEAVRAKYIQFLKDSNDNGVLPDSSAGSANAIDYIRNTLAPRRCLILRINQARMYRDMQMSLDRFIERELPIGVVLLKENMINNF